VENVPATYAIQVSCINLSLHPEDSLEIIKQYSTRNETMHASFIPLVKKGLFTDVAQRLWLDRCDIPLFISPSETGEQKILERLLDSMIDLWFNRDGVDISIYQMWLPTMALKEKWKQLNGNGPVPQKSEAVINGEIAKEITKSYKANLKRSSTGDELINLYLGLTGKKKPPKRVASAQLEEERERQKVRKQKWESLVKMLGNGKTIYDVMILSAPDDCPPRDIVEDNTL
jgi:hypothetical protein